MMPAGTDADQHTQSKTQVFLKMLTWLMGTAYLVVGSVLVLGLLIGGLAEGFAHLGYIAEFLLFCAYIFFTVSLSFAYSRRPRRALGWMLAVLYLPGLLFFLRVRLETSRERQLVVAYLHSPDPSAAAKAKEQLDALPQRSGRKPAVEELLRELRSANSDEVRIKIVPLLGKLSYQHQGVLQTLQA